MNPHVMLHLDFWEWSEIKSPALARGAETGKLVYMKYSTVQSIKRSNEKGIRRGQSDRISGPSIYWFRVYEGIFEHAPIMGDAVWLFMWLVARTTDDGNGKGKVLGGRPITDEEPAAELGVPVKTVRRWRKALANAHYVNTIRTPYGATYTLLKSKKWQAPTRDLPKREIPESKSVRDGKSECPNREKQRRIYRDNTST